MEGTRCIDNEVKPTEANGSTVVVFIAGCPDPFLIDGFEYLIIEDTNKDKID